MVENEENKDLEGQETPEGSETPEAPESPQEPIASSIQDADEEEFEKITVKQVSTKWGVIAGIVGIVVFLIMAMTGLIFKSSVSWIGIIPFIVIVVLAHKEFKNEGNIYMPYSKGLGIGVFISGISAVIQSLFSYVYIKFIDTEYYVNQTAAMVEQWENQGMTDEQIEAAMGFTSNMQNPELGILLGIIGGIFFGFIVSLVVTAFTKKTNPDEEI